MVERTSLLTLSQEHLGVLNEAPVDLQFNHSGYLFLANENVAHIMEDNHITQRCLDTFPSFLPTFLPFFLSVNLYFFKRN